MEDDGEHSSLKDPASFTYRELDERTDALAQCLIHQYGIQIGDRVAVATHRCVAMIVAVIAIQKAGGAFVALDPAHPAERKEMVIEDCDAVAVITMTGILDGFALPRGLQGLKLHPDGSVMDSQDYPLPVLMPQVSSENVCFLYYTSGSTGKPKGVVVEHRNVINQLWHFQRRY